jgi:metal-dependent amidase/aminoacylase/carboxypeptidase family protein
MTACSTPLPDAAFALHVIPNAPHGTLGGRAGPLLASADQFRIVVQGRGGHASLPHQTLDPVPVACEIVTALQAMITRKFSVFDPVSADRGADRGGTTFNVMPDSAEIEGTMRSLSADKPRNAAREPAAGRGGHRRSARAGPARSN